MPEHPHTDFHPSRVVLLAIFALFLLPSVLMAQQEKDDPPKLEPPQNLQVEDTSWDDGTRIDISFELSPDDEQGEENPVRTYELQYSQEKFGVYQPLAPLVPSEENYKDRSFTFTLEKLKTGENYYFRVRAAGKIGEEEAKSDWIITQQSTTPTREWFNGDQFWLGTILVVICGSVVVFIGLARSGRPLKVRKIAGLEAVDEAVGRATEMGRTCLFVPGIQDISDIQTVAGLTILSRVAKTAAEYDARVEVPTSRSLVMTTARETVQSAFLSAGRPDAYNEDNVYYVTDEQFGYVAYLSGMMVREKPAACFYMGSFFAESLILAETGNSIGAIQVAGTAQPAQLPFFVAACDYTLIGEEFFAASAYLSGDPDQLGSLKGQDVGKLIVGAFVLVGCLLATLGTLTGSELLMDGYLYLKDTVLN